MAASRCVALTLSIIACGVGGCFFDETGQPINAQSDASAPGDGAAIDAPAPLIDAPAGIDAPTPPIDAAVPIDAAAPIDAAPPACWNDPNYDQVHPLTGHRYRVYDAGAELRRWYEARDVCDGAQAHLAVIDNAVENAFVFTLPNTSRFWIGLHDENVEDTFEWVTGAPVAYTNWNVGEPNNSGGNENCVHMRGGALWNDDECDDTDRAFICECDPDYISAP